MKADKKHYSLCYGLGCPIRDTCGRYREYICRSKNDWFGVTPYIHNKPKPFPNGTNCYSYDHVIIKEENN